MRCFSECKGSLIVAKGQTYKEKLFLRKVAEGYYIVREDGTVFNTHTGRYVGDRENVNLYPNISFRIGKTTYTLSRHVLVWLIFKGDIPYNMEVNHIDGNKHNTRLDNLELVTSKGNKDHAWKMGLAKAKSGENARSAKLTNDDVIYYRDLVNGKIKSMAEKLAWVKKISKAHDLRPQSVRLMLEGHHYKNLGGKLGIFEIRPEITEIITDMIKRWKTVRHFDTMQDLLGINRITIKKYIPAAVLERYPPIRKNGVNR